MSTTELREEIIARSQAGVDLRDIEQQVIDLAALDEDERAGLWLLAWSLPTTRQGGRTSNRLGRAV
jgi:hypothetical protein